MSRPVRWYSTSVSGMPAAFWYLWVGTLLNRLGSFVLPFLALYLTAQRALTPTQAGLIVALYGAGGLAASFAGGVLADRIGRRATLVTSMLGGAACMVAVPLAPGLPAMAAAVLALGFLGELYRPAVAAAVADLVPDADRTRAYALLYWAINVGAAVAPVMAGLLAARSYTAIFVANALSMAAFGLLMLAKLPETRPTSPIPAVGTLRGWRTALRDPSLLALTGLAFLISTVFFQAFTTLPLSMRADGLTETDYGLAIAANGTLVVLVSLPVAAWITRFSTYSVMAVAAVLIGLGFGLTLPAVTLLAYVAAIAIWTMGEIAFMPVAQALVSRMAPADQRGTYQGVYHAASGLAMIAGPAAGGFVFDRAGEAALWMGCLVVCVLASGGFYLLGRRTRQPAQPAA
jgi:MFS family permease